MSPCALRDALAPHDPRVADAHDRLFRFDFARTTAPTFLAQRRVFEHVRQDAVPDPLFVEESVLSLLDDVLTAVYGWATPTPPRQRRLAEDARALLCSTFASGHSLTAIAEAVGASAFHLCRVFKRHTGQTIHAYRGQLRLRHSLELAFVIDADDTGAALGAMFLSVPGDVDGDGTPDVYASDFSNAAKGASTGRIVVHSGRTGRHLLTLTGETAGEGFGTSPSVAGDVDGDGAADFIVGAWQYSGAAASGGRVYLYSGKDGTLIKTITCRVPGDTFGFDANEVGDVDRDGIVDLLITSAWSGVRGFHSGRMFVISSGVRGAPSPR